MASQLSLYNDALLLCGERTLSALTDSVEARRLLDNVWNNGGVDYCLSQGSWPFALRTVQLDYDSSISPAFGYAYAHSKPTDFIATVAISDDEYVREPFTDYMFEQGYWWADVTPLYIRYVSNDANFGTNYGEWPPVFKEFVAAYFASKIALKVTGDPEKTELIIAMWKRMESDAKQKAARDSAPPHLPSGSWTRSRHYGWRNRDRGNTGSLTG